MNQSSFPAASTRQADPPMVRPVVPVVQSASAHEPTGTTANPPCETPGCTWHAVISTTVDVHFATGPTWRPDQLAPYRTRYLACLPCYAHLRRGQADGYLDIVFVGAL